MPPTDSRVLVERVTPPDSLVVASRLGRVDYGDAHTVSGTVAVEREPEAWVREMLDHSDRWFRRTAHPAWLLLGLRHGARTSPGHVLGWPIAESTPERVVLAAESRTGMPAELVLNRDVDAWVFATLIRFDNRAMRVVWRGIAGAHRAIVRDLLRSAASRLTDSVGGLR